MLKTLMINGLIGAIVLIIILVENKYYKEDLKLLDTNQRNIKRAKANSDMIIGAMLCTTGMIAIIIIIYLNLPIAFAGIPFIIPWGLIISGAIIFFRGLAKK